MLAETAGCSGVNFTHLCRLWNQAGESPFGCLMGFNTLCEMSWVCFHPLLNDTLVHGLRRETRGRTGQGLSSHLEGWRLGSGGVSAPLPSAVYLLGSGLQPAELGVEWVVRCKRSVAVRSLTAPINLHTHSHSESNSVCNSS